MALFLSLLPSCLASRASSIWNNNPFLLFALSSSDDLVEPMGSVKPHELCDALNNFWCRYFNNLVIFQTNFFDNIIGNFLWWFLGWFLGLCLKMIKHDLHNPSIPLLHSVRFCAYATFKRNDRHIGSSGQFSNFQVSEQLFCKLCPVFLLNKNPINRHCLHHFLEFKAQYL